METRKNLVTRFPKLKSWVLNFFQTPYLELIDVVAEKGNLINQKRVSKKYYNEYYNVNITMNWPVSGSRGVFRTFLKIYDGVFLRK